MIVVAKLLVLWKYDQCKKCKVLRFHEKPLQSWISQQSL